MSRDIKFRAWNSATSTLHENVGMDPYAKYHYVFDKSGGIVDMYGSMPTLMQYTRLKDKEGKEIYEGDILKTDRGLFEVFWREGFAGFYLRSVANPDWIDLISMTGNVEWCEVVGDIYQHPELLQQPKED